MKNTTIALPRLQVKGFDDSARMKLNANGSILVMYREWMDAFFNIQEKMMQEPPEKILGLTGPKGIGKSYCLYLLCARLRQKGYRVIYLPSIMMLQKLADNKEHSVDRLVKEFYMVFPDAVDKRLQEWQNLSG